MAAVVVALAAPHASTGVRAADESLSIIVPATPGGGYDQLARALQETMAVTRPAVRTEVVNNPGAGGVVGLAQLITGHAGDSRVLMVAGLSMLASARQSLGAVSLEQATPIARLTGEYEGLAVRTSSGLRTLDDVVHLLRVDHAALSFGGGPLGGVDQTLVSYIARSLGIDPVLVSYTPFSGGGDLTRALLAGGVSVGVAGLAEFGEEVRNGKLRLVAISSERRLPGLDVPTLNEAGFDLVLVNWRGVFAPPHLGQEEQRSLAKLFRELAASPEWRATLARHRWHDLYLSGEDFAHFIQSERDRSRRPEAVPPARFRARAPWAAAFILRNAGLLAVATVAVAALAAGALGWHLQTSARRERELARQLERAQQAAQHQGDGLGRSMVQHIDAQLEGWMLTAAERDVALLLLKGLRHKEIAAVRETSERTVRQQSLAIYKKAGVAGRSDLIAHFLNSVLTAVDAKRDALAAPEKPERLG